MSSINFAIQTVQEAVTASVVSNMGAPLKTGNAEDAESGDQDDIHFSSDPFSFGLDSEAASGEEQSDVALVEDDGASGSDEMPSRDVEASL